MIGKRIITSLSSLRLTVVLLGLCMVLIFIATIAQVELGIHEVVQFYFRSWFAWFDVIPGEKKFSIPIPGGILLGSLLIINLLAAHGSRFQLNKRKTGMLLIHSGILLMLISEILTGLLGKEAQMVIDEGQTLNYSVYPREVELVLIEPTSDGLDTVHAIPQSRLKDGATFDIGNISLHMDRYYENADILDEAVLGKDADPLRATAGVTEGYGVRKKPRETAKDMRNIAASFVSIRSSNGEDLGRWLVSNAISSVQSFMIGGKTWKIAMRQARMYHPFSFKLLDFSHERYVGTDIPKNFSSKIRVLNSVTGEDREVLIYMNHPLRYQGLTFYQAGLGNDDKASILQVVNNPAWTLPYISCGMVSVGLLWVFLSHLCKVRQKAEKSIQAEETHPIAWVIPSACIIGLLLYGMMITRKEEGFDFRGFGSLPVVSNGRVQPLDSLARNTLLGIHTKQKLRGENVPSSASAWFAELAFKPTVADERKNFLVQHDDVLGLANLPRGKEKFFSFNQLKPAFPQLQSETVRIDKINAQQRSVYEKALINLTRNLFSYNQLKHAIALPQKENMEQAFSSFVSQVTMALDAAKQATPPNQTLMEDASTRMKEMLAWEPYSSVYTTPPLTGDDGWRKLPDSVIDAAGIGALPQAALAYARMGDAYRENNTMAFNAAVAEYQSWLSSNRKDFLFKAKAESIFNRIAPFYLTMVIYMMAFLFAAISWLIAGPTLRQIAFRTMLLGFSMHTVGLITRMLLEDRPPVTNLYSSAVFIGWGVVLLSILLELHHRNAIGTAVATVVGFATLLIAHHLSLSGDTLEMMRAVLDTNLWLATHVVIITLGYSATFLAGAIALFWIVMRAFGRQSQTISNSMRGMVYGIICFATLASFVGTVLGGIWADQSWGRFWGWDPKENGALLIVIWNAIILHARWGGIVKDRGIMVMAVFGNIITSWSWFGTNMLGIGLHSYGFTDAAFVALSAFIASQIFVILMGFLPHLNKKASL